MASLSLRASVASMVIAGALLAGCGGHTARTLPMRTALDEGQPKKAIEALDKELDVKKDTELPSNLEGDNALLVLDRASIQQSLVQFPESKQDFQAADKAIDMLDLASNAGDTIGKYIFSDASGRYRAPPYEKLLINTLNMINYLESQDLGGARVEARRLSVIMSYFHDKLREPNAVLGLGGFLAGLTFEKSGDANEALRYYDEALQFGEYRSLRESVRALLPRGTYRSPRLNAVGAEGGASVPVDQSDEGEIVFVLGYGRVPHKIANRIPIGLALTYVSGALSPADVSAANKLAAQGLVSWINFPSLGPETATYGLPSCVLDGRPVEVEQAVNVSHEVRAEWKKVEGQAILSAITRLVSRVAVGKGVEAAAGKDSIWGFVASLGLQAGLTALDTPDTRSWETLPARVAVARVRVAPGRHELNLEARGVSRRQTLDVPKGGWALVSLMALR